MSDGQRRTSSGGAAGAGGYSLSSRVAAFYAVGVLRGRDWPVRWGLPTQTRLVAVALETDQAVDDLLLKTSAGGQVLLQIKRNVTASSGESLALASAVDQFVRQYLGVGAVDGQRAFDPTRDRLVLACGSRTGGPIARALPAVLGRVRDDAPDDLDDPRLRDAAERSAWSALLTVARRAWQQHGESAPTDEQLMGLLRIVYVEQLEVETAERDEDGALGWLRASVLGDPAQDRLAWTTLIEKALSAGAARSGADARRLREVLASAGVQLAVPTDIRADVERLGVRSDAALAHLAVHGGLSIDGQSQALQRELAAPLMSRVLGGSCLTVGAPGAGKSGALHALAGQLRQAGHDVVVIAADMLEVADLDELRDKLQLSRPVIEILADWPGDRPGVVLIDALDAARGPDGPEALVQLVEQIASAGGRWHVAASVRTFDLRHNRQLRAAVPASSAAADHVLSEFCDVGHFHVGDLSDSELSQLEQIAPTVGAVLDGAPQPLRRLVANPFNLSLLARLVQRHVEVATLRPLRTQLQLLELYWSEVVYSPARGSDERHALLATLCRLALADMRLQVERAAVAGAHGGTGLHELLSGGVLIEVPAGGLLEPERLSFSHHVLFDYAFARLVLEPEADALTAQLAADPDLLLLARPSLVMRLTALWEQGAPRAAFWQVALALTDAQLTDPVRLVAPSVIVDLIADPDDLTGLITLARSDETVSQAATALLAETVSALFAAGDDARPLRRADVELWARVAAMTGEGDSEPALAALRMLVWALWREAEAASATGPPAPEANLEAHEPEHDG